MFGLFKKDKRYKNIGVSELKRRLGEPNSVVLDVRSESELSEGSVPGYKMINVSRPDFAEKVSKLDKDKTYFVYCRAGGRSAKACKMMADLGFENLHNVRGGILAWNIRK